jgi:hypothetical protein
VPPDCQVFRDPAEWPETFLDIRSGSPRGEANQAKRLKRYLISYLLSWSSQTDGHGWQVMWMDPAAAEQGPEAFAASTQDADAAA